MKCWSHFANTGNVFVSCYIISTIHKTAKKLISLFLQETQPGKRGRREILYPYFFFSWSNNEQTLKNLVSHVSKKDVNTFSEATPHSPNKQTKNTTTDNTQFIPDFCQKLRYTSVIAQTKVYTENYSDFIFTSASTEASINQ